MHSTDREGGWGDVPSFARLNPPQRTCNVVTTHTTAAAGWDLSEKARPIQ